MNGPSATFAFFRLELAEARRSRWVAFTFVVYALLFGAFVLLGLRESTVLGFTGMSRVVLNVSNAVLVAVPLVWLVSTSQTIVRARANGTFEMLLSQPCRRSDWFVGLVASRLLVLLAPLFAMLVVASLVGGAQRSDPALLPTVLRSLAIAAALAWAFTGLGMLVSSVARTPERAVVYSLVAWVTACALHDFALIGVLLRWQLPPRLVFLLAALNPIEAARLGILSGIDPELSILGPVGFWLATTLGPALTLGVAIGWPALLGGVFLFAARRRFASADLV
jgi:ABC-2 type transport system permease protein